MKTAIYINKVYFLSFFSDWRKNEIEQECIWRPNIQGNDLQKDPRSYVIPNYGVGQKGPVVLTHKTKDTFFTFTNNFVALDMESVSAISRVL